MIRWNSKRSEIRLILRRFEEWSLIVGQLPPIVNKEKKIAIVRLDDIGDYLLFRNFLSLYKKSALYKGYNITLIGNIVWKSIFDQYDAHTVDDTIWVDKHQYLTNSDYRLNLWQQTHNQNFETVICPSRTRPLLLDDLIALSTGATYKIASVNSFPFRSMNVVSDPIYTRLFPANKEQHEYFFNQAFNVAITAEEDISVKPYLPFHESHKEESKQIICFIGAAAKSKVWPIHHWVSLIKLLKNDGFEPIIAGGKNESDVAQLIMAEVNTLSLVGETSLTQTLSAIASAKAVITGDTMAAHAAVSFAKPTVILANGVNAKRFVAYKEAGVEHVRTIYTKQYRRYLIDNPNEAKQYGAVSKDMNTISPRLVLNALQHLLR
jgi:ADP-heptose:LPS heptosyltransferase